MDTVSIINRIAKYALAAMTLSVGLSTTTVAAQKSSFWQLTLQYDGDSLRILEAGVIPPMRKQSRTPGLNGAPVKISYAAEWLDVSGNTLTTTALEVPLGIRSTLEQNKSCQYSLPNKGVFVVRLTGPTQGASPSALRLRRDTSPNSRALGIHNPRSLAIPAVFEKTVVNIEIESFSNSNLSNAGPVSVTKIRDVGPDANRLVMVVFGDGYTAANLGAGNYTQDVNGLWGIFEARAPWDVLFDGVNIYRVDVESVEEGADNDPQGTFVNTYFNSTFWSFGIQRALTIDNIGVNRAIDAANSLVGVGVWDELVMIVNSATYGGTGGFISVSSVHTAAPEIVLHEFGHTFAALADEYVDASINRPPADPEPNVDLDFDLPNLKWSMWVEPGTPLPTPPFVFSDKVGAFEGARYLATGVYRPWDNCLMRSLGQQFGPICKETHVLTLMSRISLADSISPNAGIVLITPDSVTFSATTLSLPGIVYQWRINGAEAPISTEPTFTLSSSDLLQPTNALELSLSYVTPLVRKDSMFETYSWTAISDCNTNGIADSLDIVAGALDANSNWIPDQCETVFCCATPGDADHDGSFNIADVTFGVARIFSSGPAPFCQDEADADGDNSFNIADVTYGVARIFSSGPAPICGATGQ